MKYSNLFDEKEMKKQVANKQKILVTSLRKTKEINLVK